MRTKRVTLGAAGCVILPLDPHKITFNATYQLFGDQAVSLTCQVDGTISKLDNFQNVSYSSATNTVTLTFAAPHGIPTTTSYVNVKDSTSGTGIDGVYQVASVTSPTVLTYTSTGIGTKSGIANVCPLVFNKSVVGTATGSTTVSTAASVVPMTALILNVTSYSAGTEYLEVLQTGLT